jgi:hypothetical protein
MKNNSIILKIRDLPDEKVKDLGLSCRNIGNRCHSLTKKYLSNINRNSSQSELIARQQKIRRDLSNWVNNPNNLVDSKGKYIGDKFGARITVSNPSGYVFHDVETFCRDVKNKNNRILGKNNNYIFIKNDVYGLDNVNKQYRFSTLNVSNVENSNILYSAPTVYKVKSSLLPSSDPSSNLIRYSPSETSDGDTVPIVSGQIMDLHTTRKEFIQAACGKYGYNSRLSSTSGSVNHYVCKNVNDTIFVRLSYFPFPPANILDIAAQSGNFTTLITALKATNLDSALSEGVFTVFAPTDAAFAKLPAGTVSALLQDLPTLTNILKYHVVAGKVMAADVVKLTSALTLLSGKNVTVSVQNGKVFINNAEVVITDIVASNGVIHVIDTVLTPPPLF